MFEFLCLIGASLLVAAVFWAFRSTRAWQLLCIIALAIAKLHAVALVGVGGGLLTAGLSGLVVGEAFEIGSPSVLMGTGVGLLTGGILLLWLTMRAGVPQLVPPSEPRQRGLEFSRTPASIQETDESEALDSPTARLASA